jgi:hypothetical protein
VGRWRLVLGKDAEAEGLSVGDDPQLQRIEALVGFLFEGGGGAGGSRQGGRGGSALTIPAWIDEVSELFPSSKAAPSRRWPPRRA